MREYVPLVAVVLAWLAIGACAGPADALRLLAAVTFVRAARALTAPASLFPLRLRIRSGAHVRQARRAALATEAAAFAGALVALVAMGALLWRAGQGEMLLLALLFSLATPVRSLMPLAAGRYFASVYRLVLGVVGLALVAAGWLAGADIFAFALLLAAREWLSLPIAYALSPPIRSRGANAGELGWHEIAAHSYTLGRKRAAYRFSKTFLQAGLGPIGSIAARTGRGIRLDSKLERFIPTHPAALGSAALVAVAGATALIVYWPEPALLVVAASLFRVAAAAANVLLWGRLSGWGDATVSDTDDAEDL